MGIPVIREVHYTDDGCTLYECLSCKNRIESRSSAMYRTLDGVELVWKFCPHCGVEFKSFKLEDQDKSYNKYWDDPRARTDRLSPCTFIIEERFVDDQSDYIEKWKPLNCLTYTNPIHILRALRSEQNDERNLEVDKQLKCHHEYQIRKVG